MNVASKKKNKVGRPNKYETHVQPRLEEIGWWCRDGLIDDEIIKRLGVGKRSYYEYKKKYPQFLQVLKESKEVTNYRVINALVKKAEGFTHDGKYYPPDTAAIIVFLKNRAGWHNRDSGSADNDTGKLDQLISAITNTKRV